MTEPGCPIHPHIISYGRFMRPAGYGVSSLGTTECPAEQGDIEMMKMLLMGLVHGMGYTSIRTDVIMNSQGMTIVSVYYRKSLPMQFIFN